eukprot:10172044-Alexandrium_andersonii.AAC.1
MRPALAPKKKQEATARATPSGSSPSSSRATSQKHAAIALAILADTRVVGGLLTFLVSEDAWLTERLTDRLTDWPPARQCSRCLLYTSDAADDM